MNNINSFYQSYCFSKNEINNVIKNKDTYLIENKITDAIVKSRRVIEEILRYKSIHTPPKILENSEYQEVLRIEKQLEMDIQELFFKTIPQENLQKEMADFVKADKNLQNLLSPELRELRDQKTVNKDLKSDPKHQLQRRTKKAMLSVKLGMIPSANTGTTGTLLIESPSMTWKTGKSKKVVVFKPDENFLPLGTRIQNFFKRIFFGQLHYLKRADSAQSDAEVAAKIVDNTLGLNMTPASQKVTLGGIKGAFQVFLHGFMEAKHVKKEMDKKTSFRPTEIDLFQKMVVLDYLLGNLDRYDENWFVKMDNGTLMDIKTIDNANSFIIKNPPDFIPVSGSRKQYLWKAWKIAKEKFSENTRAFIRENLKEEKIEETFREIESKCPGFLTEDMKTLFRQRAEVLQKVANTPNESPANLATYRTDRTIKNFLARS